MFLRLLGRDGETSGYFAFGPVLMVTVTDFMHRFVAANGLA
jgi:hypothetical protein